MGGFYFNTTLCFSIIFSYRKCEGLSDQLVTITNGGLKGVEMKAENGDVFWAFLGIPYATSKRFEESSLLNESWNGVKNANKYGEVCTQNDQLTNKVIGSENCLTINVFTPMNRLKSLKNPDHIKLPVIVFIHGDEFSYGSGSQFGPKYFLNDFVVLVTFNYRLGIFGFLNTGDEISTGNYGLKDQTNALKWVNNEIDKFAGDKKLITIYGQGSGAASVHYHLLSQMSKDLFSGAIMSSGSALCHWAFDEAPKQKLPKIAKYFNCTSTFDNSSETQIKTSEFVECLKKFKASELIFDEYDDSEFNWIYEFSFVPSIEIVSKTSGKLNSNKAFLLDTPQNIIENKLFNEVPVIFGVNSNEGFSFASDVIENSNLTELNAQLPSTILKIIHKNESFTNEAVLKFLRHYFRQVDQIPNEISNISALNLSSLFSHFNWIDCTREAAILHSKKHSKDNPIYFYSFEYDGEFSSEMNESEIQNGPAHGHELQYLFNNEMNTPGQIFQNEWDKEISEDILAWWLSFARYRDPNPLTMLGQGVDWNPMTFEEINVFKISNTSSHLIEDPYENAANFLKNLI